MYFVYLYNYYFSHEERDMMSLLLMGMLSLSHAQADEAFGRPGLPPTWSNAKKINVGTFYQSYKKSPKSLVWFTNVDGVLSEVFYPRIDRPQLRDSQLLVTTREGQLISERTHMHHEVKVLSPSVAQLINTDRRGRFQIKHTFYTLRDSSTLVDEVEIESKVIGLNYYLLVNPHLNNSGIGDNAFVDNNELLFTERNIRLRVYSDVGFDKASVGFVGFSDGFQDLKVNGRMNFEFSSARAGNVAGMGKLNLSRTRGKQKFYILYDFSGTHPSINGDEKKEYHETWLDYLRNLKSPRFASEEEKKLYYRSLFTIKTHENKNPTGSMAASLSKPWGDLSEDTSNGESGGYHLTWPRDLFHKALALLNAGDRATAYRSLKFLKSIQYKNGTWFYGSRVIQKRGAWPQNVWTDGREYWSGFQLDQVGYPIQLFYHIYKRANVNQRRQLLAEFREMLTLAANFIIKYGPWSAQERWEENFGISPSSFAVATAALLMADEVLENGEYGKVARGWLTKPNDNIFTWTFTKNGAYGDGNYFVRVSGCQNYEAVWNPNNNQKCHISNSTIKKDQRLILDQGFLKLALMGLVKADDWRMKTSVDKVNKHISVVTPKGRGWYRYSFDAYGYGEDYKGRLWPLLSSEHGRYYIERYLVGDLSWQNAQKGVNSIIKSYVGFANEGMMIPEQVFESSGLGTGAATPLAWSHAEYIKMLWSRHYKKNVENVWSMYE
jgi:glucoamylase